MVSYYVNKKTQDNGDHEVHKTGCDYFPGDAKYLGEYDDCEDAVKEAEKTYNQVNGCYYCSNSCHTQ